MCSFARIRLPRPTSCGTGFFDGPRPSGKDRHAVRLDGVRTEFEQSDRHDMETDTDVRVSARITGRVQGVGFRNFTQMRARRLGVTGWVRNERDGSVRLEAEGPRDALQSLVDAVGDGPRLARVDDVDVDWSDADGDFDTFRVRR